MRQFSAAQSVAAFFAVLSLSLLVSCGGGTTSTNPVTSITLTPTYLSLSPGQTFQLVAQPKDYNGNNVIADVSYSSSNTNLVTVTATGTVCAGLWDPNFITCNAIKGQAAVGQANITVTSGKVTAAATTYTHLQVDRIFVTPPTGCVSMGATPTYLATVYNITAAGCSPNIPCDITSTVGPITFNSTDRQVMSKNVNSGVLTATNPGATSIYASVSGLNSIPQPALVCPVQSILIHDAASSNTVFSLSPTNTQNLIADVLDTSGTSIAPILTWSPVPASVGTLAATTSTTSTAPPPNSETFTANTGGTSIVTATCAPPTCNRNVPPQYGQNIVTMNVSGGTTTTVYAGSTNSLMLVPIQTSNNSAGTTITLPYLPNSIVSDSAGNNVYLGSGSGIMTVAATSGAVTVSTAAVGTILAISADGNYLLVSNSATSTTYLFSTSGSSAVLDHDVTASSAAFTPDGQSVSFLAAQQLYYDTNTPSSATTNLPYVSNSIDVSAQGGMTYVTSSSLGAIDVRTTCNQAAWQTLTATHPTLVAHLPNGTGAVVADSPSIDVVTTGNIAAGCPPAPQNSMNTYNLGFGNFTAQQMFVSPNSGGVFIISNLPSVIGLNLTTFTPFSIPLTNSPQPFSGGITVDEAKVYVGASDNNVHALDVASHADSAQIAPGLKDPTGNTVAPNLVLVLPK
jgi:hypothetical protein